jgi:hypothetical protein
LVLSADPTTNGELEPASVPAAGPVRVLEHRRGLLPALPIPGALVAAGGGFLAGLAAIATLRALRTRRSLTRRRRGGGKDQVTRRVVAKRSFLVDVHLLGNRNQ